jgi:hypothetical protein
MIKSDKDLGIAMWRPGGVHDGTMLRPPLWWPNIMMLNMEAYRRFERPDDWNLDTMPFNEFPYPEIFNDDTGAQKLIPSNPLVFADTGWRLAARLTFENPDGLRMLPLPPNYYMTRMRLYTGIDRNSHRPYIPWVQERLAEIKVRLEKLRTEN